MAKVIKESSVVSAYKIGEEIVPAFEVPEAIYTAMNLKVNEMLEFEYDPDKGCLKITRQFAVLNQ